MTKLLIYAPVLSGLFFAVNALFPPAASADPLLPPATYYEVASRQGVGPYHDAGEESDQVGTVSVINPAAGPGNVLSASATTQVRLSGADTLNPFVSAYSTNQNTFEGFASADIIYSFEVLGPAGAHVPLDITVNGGHAFTPSITPDYFTAFASFKYALTGDSVDYKSCATDGCNFSSSSTYLISTNEVLEADLSVDGNLPGLAPARISLDNTIAIDPANTVPDATLVFSPNLVVSTPEPATFWSLLAGFLVCMEWTKRAKRRRSLNL